MADLLDDLRTRVPGLRLLTEVGDRESYDLLRDRYGLERASAKQTIEAAVDLQ